MGSRWFFYSFSVALVVWAAYIYQETIWLGLIVICSGIPILMVFLGDNNIEILVFYGYFTTL